MVKIPKNCSKCGRKFPLLSRVYWHTSFKGEDGCPKPLCRECYFEIKKELINKQVEDIKSGIKEGKINSECQLKG